MLPATKLIATLLTDRTFSGRHLRPATEKYTSKLPADARYVSNTKYGNITGLFKRTKKIDCPRSSLLFPFFAQWFTDSFLRTDPQDFRKNQSNHGIDLCQIYGVNKAQTDLLRSKHGGRLKSQQIDGEEYGDFMFLQ